MKKPSFCEPLPNSTFTLDKSGDIDGVVLKEVIKDWNYFRHKIIMAKKKKKKGVKY